MSVNPYVWGLGAGVPAVVAEYLYRTMPGPWISHLYLWLPLQLLIGYSIYRLVNTPGVTLVDSLVVFALCTAGLRVFVSVGLLGDQVKWATWVALGLVLTANIIKFIWSK